MHAGSFLFFIWEDRPREASGISREKPFPSEPGPARLRRRPCRPCRRRHRRALSHGALGRREAHERHHRSRSRPSSPDPSLVRHARSRPHHRLEAPALGALYAGLGHTADRCRSHRAHRYALVPCHVSKVRRRHALCLCRPLAWPRRPFRHARRHGRKGSLEGPPQGTATTSRCS
jgi:hypothetical protein